MTRALDAWLEGRYVGLFEELRDGTATFRYDGDAPDTPISLSLPRHGKCSKRAPLNFLENVLPDHPTTRARMARDYDADSDGTFDLLARGGGDIAGGLVILPAGSPPESERQELNPALDRDIAGRIAALKRDPDAWAPSHGLARFSLGGTQGKFTLARLDGDWYCSNSGVPSTHIFKPARPDLNGLEAAEATALRLARQVGLAAPRADVMTVLDQSTYVAERFDRRPNGLLTTRLHAEDLAQASGTSSNEKYRMTARQALALLNRHDPDGGLCATFIDQLAFNVLLGNADAHAKNYSVLLRPDGIEMSPLYDVVPVGLYVAFDQNLAMSISGARRSHAVGPHHWRKCAEGAGLDPELVVGRVVRIAARIAATVDSAWSDLETAQAATLREMLLRNTATLLD